MCLIKWLTGSSSSKQEQSRQAAYNKARDEAQRKAGNTGLEQETASNAQTNKSNERTITSLRVPLETKGTGNNINRNRNFGLNLMG